MDRTMEEDLNSKTGLTLEAHAGAVRAHNAIQVLMVVIERLCEAGDDADVVGRLNAVAERAFAATLGCVPGQNTWKQLELMFTLERAASAGADGLAEALEVLCPALVVTREEIEETLAHFRRAGGRPRKGKRRWQNKWACFVDLAERARLGRVDEATAKKLRQRFSRRLLGTLPHQSRSS
jgi:hypothetical protein